MFTLSTCCRVLLAAFFMIMTGCSNVRNVKLDARLPISPAVKQLPLNVATYYSPEFTDYTKRFELMICGTNGKKNKVGFAYIFPVGASSRELFDQIITSMFTTVTNASSISQSFSDTVHVDGIIEPRIDSFNWDAWCTDANIRADISYVINLYNGLDRKLVTSMHVKGWSIEKPRPCIFNCKHGAATEQAIQAAMANFIIEFYEQPDVKQWLLTHPSVHVDLQ